MIMRKLSKEEEQLWSQLCESIRNAPKHQRPKLAYCNPIQVGTSLDLHGYTESAAYSSVAQLIVRNHQAGNKQVTIITGKGKTSPGILRRLVPLWLQSSLNQYVRSFHFDPKNTGQLIVLLK